MSLKEKLLEDIKNAMKEKNTVKKDTVRMVRAAILQIEKDSKITLDDHGVLDVLAKELKKRKDSLPEFEKSGRVDLIDTLKSEIDVLIVYLPQQLTEAEVEDIVKSAIAEVGATSARDIGKVMQAVLPKVKARADGKMVSQAVKKFLE